jgi:hypothetical protein
MWRCEFDSTGSEQDRTIGFCDTGDDINSVTTEIQTGKILVNRLIRTVVILRTTCSLANQWIYLSCIILKTVPPLHHTPKNNLPPSIWDTKPGLHVSTCWRTTSKRPPCHSTNIHSQIIGHAMAQAVSRRPLSAGTCVWSPDQSIWDYNLHCITSLTDTVVKQTRL